MNQSKLSANQIVAVGLMLFALFLGAGNIIFPPFLGQQAGTNVWITVIGFLITGVGLPLLGIVTIARTGSFRNLTYRVGPRFGEIFPIIVYLTIGPLFATPRTGTVTFEVGITPFLSESLLNSPIPLLIFTLVFFSLTAWLSMNPSKLVGRIGKMITPLLFTVIVILVAKSMISPMGVPSQPITPYDTQGFYKGFIEGYLTMDAIASLVFGIVVINSLKGMGLTKPTALTKACIQAGIIAATGLALVYISLGHIGATSFDAIGAKENGGAILAAVAQYLYGQFGSIIVALIITLACITTSTGLVSSCAEYFNELFPKFSYKFFVFAFSLFSMLIANVGLTQLIKISLPALVIIYPLAIVLMLLAQLHDWFGGYSRVYIGALTGAGIVSLFDGLKQANIVISSIDTLLQSLPLAAQGVAWVVPAIIGGIIGFIFKGKSAYHFSPGK